MKILILLLFLPFVCFAQKVTYGDNSVRIEDKRYTISNKILFKGYIVSINDKNINKMHIHIYTVYLIPMFIIHSFLTIIKITLSILQIII